jgi:hypothetical protein
MVIRFVKLFLLLLSAGATCAFAQIASHLPNAPSMVTADLGAATPEPPNVSREMAAMTPLPPFTPAVLNLAQPAPRPKVNATDKRFVALGAAVFGLTAMDLEFTQYCLHAGTCRELNPLLPHSRLGMYAVNVPINVAVMYFAHHRHAAAKADWWVAPAADIGSHMIGVGSNIRFLGK